jgi:Electron transfer DM13
MVKLISFLALLFFISSCKKSALDTADETLPTGTTILMGSFNSNAHSTSGTVKVVREASGKIQLVFENLRTDNGPDLRVWLSPSNSGSPYQEVGLLKAVTGNFSYELGASINYTTNNRVLIWCEDFSILFGHAVLQ